MIERAGSSGIQASMASALEGVQSGTNTMHEASAQLSQFRQNGADINSAAINLVSGQMQAEASAEVLRRTDGMVGTIIDIFV